ncbi:MAG: T9SS type A sorting domain-containing protein [Flavobacteriales bacterium]
MKHLYKKMVTTFSFILGIVGLNAQEMNASSSLSSTQFAIPTCSSITAPYLETFDNSFFYDPTDPYSLDSCWYQTTFNIADSPNVVYNSSVFTETTEWFKNGFANVGDSGAITLRVGDDVSNSLLLISPSINVGTVTDTFTLEFDLSYTDTASNSTTSFGSSFGCLQTFKVLYSKDDGVSWSILNGYEDLTFDINNVPDFPSEHYSIMLRDPYDNEVFSDNIRIGFYFFDMPGLFPCEDVFDVHLDNFEILDDVVYSDEADVLPELEPFPLAINGTSTFKAANDICIGTDTAVTILYTLKNNGPHTSLTNQIYLFANGDTIVNQLGGFTTPGGGWSFFEDVENICPGILDSAYSCTAQFIMYSITPIEANTSNDTLTIEIVSHEAATSLQVNADTSICPGDMITLNGVSNSTVTWKDGFGNLYSNGDNVSPTVTTTFFAKAGSGTCSIDEQFQVTVQTEALNITTTGSSLTATSGFDTYEWTLNGVVVGTTNPLNITSNGTYKLKATKNGCTYEKDKEIKNISVNEYDELPESIQPNPFKNVITVPIEFEVAEIYNSRGQLIITTQHSKINTQEVSPGLYTIIIRTNDKVYRQKLIKN